MKVPSRIEGYADSRVSVSLIMCTGGKYRGVRQDRHFRAANPATDAARAMRKNPFSAHCSADHGRHMPCAIEETVPEPLTFGNRESIIGFANKNSIPRAVRRTEVCGGRR